MTESPLLSASEACFKETDHLDTVTRRYERLNKVATAQNRKDLFCFLEEACLPILKKWEACPVGENDIFNSIVPFLSPSDYGLHNAIFQKNGRLAFIDFEYFGWDDPAKLTVDFVLHPCNCFAMEYKHFFTQTMADMWEEDEKFIKRAREIFPLHCLKWALLILNEFLTDGPERNNFVDKKKTWSRILEKQLAKAKKMISKAGEYDAIFT